MVSLALALIPDLPTHTLVTIQWREDKCETRGKAQHGTEDTLTASQHLLTRYPDAQIWCIRIGHHGVHRFGRSPGAAGKR